MSDEEGKCRAKGCERPASTGWCARHTARPGKRIQMCCVAKDCTWQQGGDITAVCPTHGARTTRRVPNRPYMGQSTEPSKAQVEAWAELTKRPTSHFDGSGL